MGGGDGGSKSHNSDGPAEGNTVRTLLTKATALLEQFFVASPNPDWENQSRTGGNVKVQAGRGMLFMSDHSSSRVWLESAMGSEASSQKHKRSESKTHSAVDKRGAGATAERACMYSPSTGDVTFDAGEPGCIYFGQMEGGPDPGSPVTLESPGFHCHPSRASCTSEMLRVIPPIIT